ncbi:trimethylamine methyltransferase family protein [Pseudaminobacter sp. 19-2017]|uniref:Methyltransferase n=1 Tax=Pseudaminobacter soli (ex Zhang et al. 2022) TaxID=2831468 RepID=A0A942IAZ9_9HYPH|nr:trimethylamine methyltransferase family protein [Pseudaminobacter soli]MBS3651066.1 trimethylamine methyltransferase family protein [Pseudaminobacter soli]
MARRASSLSAEREERLSARRVTKDAWSLCRNPFPPLEVVDEGGLERIEATALRILEELGLEFQNARALQILAANGAEVDFETQMVRFDRALVKELVGKAPSQFTLHARNPERDIVIGGNSIVFAPVAGPPNCSDLDRGRRPGTSQDLIDLIKLHHTLNMVHTAGGTVEPQDLPVESRHLDFCYNLSTLSDRVWGARAIGRTRIEDALDILAIVRGTDRDGLAERPGLFSVINVNSPRRVDAELLNGLMAMSEANQAVIVTPFTLAGAMSPVTIAGALAQQTAEALAVIAFTQMVRPGAPVIFGGFTSNVDMKSGAPAFGTPEYANAVLVGGQLARRWKLPYRTSNVTSSNAVDAQAVMESSMSLWAAVLAHGNFIYHSTGWLEGGLTTSFEKVIVDADMIGGIRAWLNPLDLSDDALAFDAIAATPPGGHFFGADHTLARFKTAFHPPLLADLRPHDTWRLDGGKTATERANERWKTQLASYEQPALEPDRKEALDAFVARRCLEIEARGLTS